jgi:hypothetical protein
LLAQPAIVAYFAQVAAAEAACAAVRGAMPGSGDIEARWEAAEALVPLRLGPAACAGPAATAIPAEAVASRAIDAMNPYITDGRGRDKVTGDPFDGEQDSKEQWLQPAAGVAAASRFQPGNQHG